MYGPVALWYIGCALQFRVICPDQGRTEGLRSLTIIGSLVFVSGEMVQEGGLFLSR